MLLLVLAAALAAPTESTTRYLRPHEKLERRIECQPLVWERIQRELAILAGGGMTPSTGPAQFEKNECNRKLHHFNLFEFFGHTGDRIEVETCPTQAVIMS